MPTINLGRKRPNNKVGLRKQLNIYQTPTWRKLRAMKFADKPICEDCQKQGHVHPTEEIHHIIPWEEGSTTEEKWNLAFDYDNLVSLCIECHKKRHILLNIKKR